MPDDEMDLYLSFAMNTRVVATSVQGAQVENYSVAVSFGHMCFAIRIFIAGIAISVSTQVTYPQGTRCCIHQSWLTKCLTFGGLT